MRNLWQDFNDTMDIHMTLNLSDLKFNHSGLIPCIAQSVDTGEVLMMAWMNSVSLKTTLQTGRVTYWSRSRNALWENGQTSGNTQQLVEMRIDCDQDCLLAIVKQKGPACHTGQRNCFFASINSDGRIQDRSE